MTPTKQRQLEALRLARQGTNFWQVLNLWKDRGWLPEDEFFSVVIHGPPRSFKWKLAERFKLLWPQCKATAHQGQLRFDTIAGYSLVIQTHRLYRVAGDFNVNYEVASVDKSRFFAQPWDSVKNLPYFYSLMPVLGP